MNSVVKKVGLLITSFLLISVTEAQTLKGKMLTGKSAEEQFGRKVKLSANGKVLAVAAPFNRDSGEKKGRIAVYEFDGNEWKIMGREIIPDQDYFDFGEMMDLSADGKRLMVAAPFEKIAVYDFDESQWKNSRTLIIDESSSDMISAISMTPDGQQLAVAYETAKDGKYRAKAFRQSGQNWVADGLPMEPNGPERMYGNSIVISADGSTIVIGNEYAHAGNLKKAGQISTYKKENSNWVLQANRIMGEYANGQIGAGLALSADCKILAASSTSIDLLERETGFVETYRTQEGKWVKLQPTLRPEKPHSYFGCAISISASGDWLAISMPYTGFGKPGLVRLYSLNMDQWKEMAIFRDIDGVETTRPANNTTGWSIALSADGTTLAIGFPHNDENGELSGKVMVYNLTSLQPATTN